MLPWWKWLLIKYDALIEFTPLALPDVVQIVRTVLVFGGRKPNRFILLYFVTRMPLAVKLRFFLHQTLVLPMLSRGEKQIDHLLAIAGI